MSSIATVNLNGTDYDIRATKLGSSTVGGAAKPVYLNSGTATACSSTVGGTAKPVYMNSGTVTACSGTVGSATTPVYMNSGTMTACTSLSLDTTGNATTATTATKLGSSTVGGAAAPIYLSSGAATACTTSGTYTSTGTALFTRAGAYNMYSALLNKRAQIVGYGYHTSGSYTLSTSYTYLLLGWNSGYEIVSGQVYAYSSGWSSTTVLMSNNPGASLSSSTLTLSYSSSSSYSCDAYVLIRFS